MSRFLPLLLCLTLPALAGAQAVRRVMVESFTQASCPPCAAQNPAFNALLQNNGDNVVLLKYQTSFPGFDPMNQQNPTEVAARVSYYAVNSVPNVRLDGVQNAGIAANVTQAMITNRLAQSTPIDMSLNHSISEALDSMFIECTIRNLGTDAFNPGGVVLHTAIIEKNILFPTPPGSTNEVDFKSVMRKMLPNASGAPVAAIPPGDSVVVQYAVRLPSYIYNYSRLGAVAFVQRVEGRQVYQAVESLPKPLSGAGLVDVGIRASSSPVIFCGDNVIPRIRISNDGNNTISSMDVSYTLDGGAPVTLNWTGELEAGQEEIIAFPAIQDPPSAGQFQYSVTHINGDGRDYNSLNELIRTERFVVLVDEPVGEEILESLESVATGDVPANTVVLRPVAERLMVVNRNYFAITQQVGGYGASTRSLFSNLYTWSSRGAEAHLIFDKIDLSARTNNYLRFDYAHAQYQGDNFTSNDRLRISVSTDCGENWTTVWNKAGAQLATRTPMTSRFVPTSAQWASDSISLAAFDGLSDVNVRFTVVSDYGNNIFIDNIRVNEAMVSSADEPGRLAGKVAVYPNPASDLARIEVELEAASPVTVSVFDLSGKLVETVAGGNTLSAGTHQFNWAPKAQGVFLVRVATAFGAVTERVAVVK